MSVYLCYEWHSAMKMSIFLALVYGFFGIFLFDKNNLGESIFILLVFCVLSVCMVFLGKYIDKLALKKISFSTDFIIMTSKKTGTFLLI